MQSEIPTFFHSLGPALHKESSMFHRIWPFLMQNFLHFCHIFGPLYQNLLGFCSLFWCKISYVFPILGPDCTQNVLGFSQDFPSSDANFHHSTVLAPLYQELLGFHQDFPLLMQIFTWAAAQIICLNSCQSRFSGVHLVLQVFRDIWPSNKENPSVYWHATLSCPFMASNYANSYLVPISFWSRSGCWPCLGFFIRSRFSGAHLVL